MTTTPTTRLGFEKPDIGSENNTWGDETNENWDDADEALAGFEAVDIAGSGDITLTAQQARNPSIKLNGALTGNRNVIVPTAEGKYRFWNNTSGSFSVTIKTAAGSGATLTQGKKGLFACDGTDVVKWGEMVAAVTTYGESLVAAADAAAAAALVLASKVELGGVISPSQISANQNDYNPSGLSTASMLRLSSDASRDITGLAGGSGGRVVTLHNVGSNNIVLKNADTGSTAANRFAFNADITLRANEACTLQYDDSSERWRSVGSTSVGAATDSAAGIAETATAAEVAAGSDTGRIVTPGRAQNIPGVAKFWALINGSTGALVAGHNVTSTSRSAEGRYSVTIATDFSSADWMPMVSTLHNDTGNAVMNGYVLTKAAGSCTIRTALSNGADGDPDFVMVMGFGTQ